MVYTQTVQSELLAITNIAAAAQQKSSEFTPAGKLVGSFTIDFAPEATNVPGTEIRIEAAQDSSGNAKWVPIWTALTTKSTVNNNAVDGTEAIGATVIEEATTTGLALGQFVFFKNGTLGNSEWGRVAALTASTSFTLLDALTNAQTGATWYNQAERFIAVVELLAGMRYRVVINNNYAASSVAVNARVSLVTTDSIA